MTNEAKGPKIVIDCISHNEPFFVLRAKDKAAWDTIAFYARKCKEMGSPDEHLNAVNRIAAEFLMFSESNIDKMKTPD